MLQPQFFMCELSVTVDMWKDEELEKGNWVPFGFNGG